MSKNTFKLKKPIKEKRWLRLVEAPIHLAGQLSSASTLQASSGGAATTFPNQYFYNYDAAANRTTAQKVTAQTARIGGTVSTGDVLTITVNDPALSGGTEAVNYTVLSGDTTTSIGTNLAAAITADTNLQTLGVNAAASSGLITIKSASNNVTTYSESVSGGATETITLGVNKNAIQNATIGGSKTTSDTVTIKVFDAGLSGGSEAVTYTVLSGDTLTSIATGLKSAINADSNLSGIGVTATSAATVVCVKSTSNNLTTYKQSTSTGATETVTLAMNMNAEQTAVIGGSKTTSDTVSIVFNDPGLSGGTETVTYTVLSGDTLSTIASGLASAINSDSHLQGIGVAASSSSTVITISSNSPNITSYYPSLSSGATETVTLNINPNGVQTAAVGGSKTTGDVLTVTVYDQGLSGGTEAVNYTVLSGDTLTSIATNMAAAINADSNLSAIGVSATSASTIINIKSVSQNATTYKQSVSVGATETITLGTSASVLQSTYNNVNELTGIAAGGSTRFQGTTNKPVKSVTLTGSVPATLNWSENFTGNATLSTGNNNTSVAAVDGGNNTKTNNYQISVSTGSSQSLTFDSDGNMTSDGTNSYAWDVENRLIKITYPGSGNNSQFAYDGLGHCISIVETSGGTTTSTKQFVWCGDQMCEARNASSTITAQYFPLGETISSTSYYYTRDHLGSTLELTDSSGNIKTTYQYDPYGRVTQTQLSGSLSSDFQYAGYYYHAPSGLNLTLNRLYSANLGRWINRDPIGEIGGVNLYAYVRNNTISFIDPDGTGPQNAVFGAGVGAEVGGIVGGAVAGAAFAPAGGLPAIPTGISGAQAGALAGAAFGANIGWNIPDLKPGSNSIPNPFSPVPKPLPNHCKAVPNTPPAPHPDPSENHPLGPKPTTGPPIYNGPGYQAPGLESPPPSDFAGKPSMQGGFGYPGIPGIAPLPSGDSSQGPYDNN